MNVVSKLSRIAGAVALGGLLFLASADTAQARPAGGEGKPQRGNPAEHMSERLQLSSDQQTQIKAIFDKRFAAHKAEREAREAQMTPEQKAQREARHKERMAQREKGERPTGPRTKDEKGPDDAQRAAFRQKMVAERTALDNEIKAVLTPEQQVEFEKMKSERKERRGQRGGERSRG